MSGPDGDQSEVRIARLHAHFLVPGEDSAATGMRSVGEHIAALRLPGALASALAPYFRPDDPAVWLVRRLEVGLEVDLDADHESFVRSWASEIAGALVRSVQEGPEVSDVLRFPNRAAYLECFLTELARGSAWDKWYYAPFEGLRALPISSALRTAISEETGAGLAALNAIPEHGLAGIIAALSPADARRVLDAWVLQTHGVDEARCFRVVWDIKTSSSVSLGPSSEEECTALRLFLAAARREPGLVSAALRDAARALTRLARRLAGNSADWKKSLLAAWGEGSAAALYRAAGPRDAPVLEPLLKCPREWVENVMENMHPPARARPASGGGTCETRFTRAGGAFLLLPLIDALPLADAVAGWPQPEETNSLALTRFLILLKCLGEERADDGFRDAVLRDWMRIPSVVSPSTLSHWLASVSFENLQSFLRVLADWGMQEGVIGGRTLAFGRARLRGGSVGVLIDRDEGRWLFAAGFRAARPDHLLRRLESWVATPERMLCDECFLESARERFRKTPVEPLHRSVAGENAARGEEVPGLESLEADLAYLALPRALRGPRSADLALSVAAQGVLRALARKLPGFGRSSLAYLHANFLDCAAAVEEQSNRRVVSLGRPPIHMVLSLAGLSRWSYRLSWLGARPCEIYPEE